jgi:hypothetical protein
MATNNKIFYSDAGQVKEAKSQKLEEILQAQAEMQEQARFIEAEQQAKEEAKASAMAKLTALGLNEEEVQAIVGA